MDGWIKLHRRLLGWEWHKDANTLSVFVHLLLLAAHKPHEVDGITLEAGQVLISLRKLATLTGLSFQNVRTALAHLQLTQQVTQQKAQHLTHAITIITICKWESYQAFFAEPNTTESTTPNTRPNTITRMNIQELVGVKGAGVCAREESDRAKAAAMLNELRSQLYASQMKQEALQRCTRLPLADVLRLADEAFADWEVTEEPASGITWGHLLSVIRIKAEIEKRQPQSLQDWKQQEAARANQELNAYFSQFKNPKN